MFVKQKTLLAVMIAATCTSAFANDLLPPVGGAVGDVPFPDRQRSYLPEGDFVDAHDVRAIRPGLSKDQVRLRLGNPHFSEGIAGVREWNYVLNFRNGQGDDVITCQYQVRYDKQDAGYRVASTHWDGPDCLQLVNREPEPAPSVATSEDYSRFNQSINVSTDALFRFAGADADDILPGGREKLEAVAVQLSKGEAKQIKVVGHADAIGSDADNRVLSRRRAETVQDYLAQRGVKEPILVEGRGESEPAKQCSGASGEDLIACLVPNRRVELIVEGLR